MTNGKILNLKQMQLMAKERNGECLSTKYINCETKLKWKCEEGHIWKTTPKSIRNDNHWCPYCSSRKANSVILSTNIIEFLNGELLGDGCLQREGSIKYPPTSARYSHGTKHKEYLAWLSKIFKNFGLEQSGKINSYHMISKKINHQNWRFMYVTRYYKELGDLFSIWYLNNFKFCPSCEILFHLESVNHNNWIDKRYCPICKEHYLYRKVIPKDIKLSPTVIRQWYIGDGCLQRLHGEIKRIILCTDSLLREDNLILIKLLKNTFGINSNLIYQKNKDGYRLRIRKSDMYKFFEYIGKCPEEIQNIYGYKWPTKVEMINLRKLQDKKNSLKFIANNKNWLLNEYHIDKRSARNIGIELGISSTTIRDWLIRYDIPIRKYRR